ncbi:succinate dehydrogenase cytochrome b subunit [Leptospira sp. GIMC2001]|uniref:succinate dehydrogenase cytochrome b subunit n=1 Tax=Leptospira sp. GIMC2001 TaxID=1513297 RepID=UPI00234A643C|nr:succinate dehydrogenase cytochrome b subunit [Leptospira sp. GIMC2001]WCL48039.1 succinate dehydrogenase cytochrome b subunit [Leptospira sp. GIMC2001]
MNFTSGYFTTSVGKKFVVAVTGVLLFGFVIFHMIGNLQVYIGPEKFNAYAKFLKDLGPLLWVARIGLLVAVLLHIGFTIQLARENRAARPVAYAYMKTKQASSASRFMVMSGLTVMAFIVYHLLHFTLGVTNPEYLEFTYNLKGEQVHDAYAMFVSGFSVPIVSAFYILSVGLLCWHLSHGVASLFQTLGVDSPKHEPNIRKAAIAFSLLIFIGNTSMPLAVLFGFVK